MSASAAVLGMIAVAIAVTAAPVIVRAQVGERSSAPIDITADQAEVVQSKCLAIWRGAAEALQGDTRLRADTITVYSIPKGVDPNGQAACGGTDRIIADGHVYYVTPEQHARGDHAVYTAAADQIVMTGDVIVVKGQDVARGDKLTIEVSTKQATLQSDVTGPGKAGRVRGVYYPDKPLQPGTAKPGSAQPTSGGAKP